MADQTANIVDRLDRGIGVADIVAAATACTEVTQTFRNDGNIMVFIVNGDASPHTATLKSQPDSFGRGGAADTQNDEAITVPAGEVGFFPFANPAMFNATGVATIVLDAFTSMKILLVRVRKAR